MEKEWESTLDMKMDIEESLSERLGCLGRISHMEREKKRINDRVLLDGKNDRIDDTQMANS
jgi:hypothetical protein